MTKITLNNVASLIDSTTAANTINANSATVQTAFDNTLSRDGTSPNVMNAPLDMNSNQVLNLPAPVSQSSPLRLQDLSTFTGAGTVTNIPTGGTAGQVLAKNSGTNYDVSWQNGAQASLASGTNISITGTTPATVSTTTNPNFTTSVTTPTLVLGGIPLSGTTGSGSVVASTSPTITTPVISSIVNTGTLTLPTTTDTLVGRATIDTLTNKTLTSPVISTITNIGTLTLPTSTDTLVGRATTDTLTNKTLTSPVISTITNTGTLTLPTSTDTIVGRATTDTLTNKTLTSPTLVTPILGVATATSINGSTVSPGHYSGEPSSGNALAGEIGEYIQSVVLSPGISITTNTQTNITSISLTAGDWDVDAVAYYLPTATTSTTRYAACVSNVSATFQANPGQFADFWIPAFVNANAGTFNDIIPPYRFSLAATTTIYLVGLCVFSASTMTVYGIVRARRVR